jgi:hypothetical protein
LYRYTRNFGLGDRTCIRLPGEENGIVHPVDKWSGRTLVTMAIGQEVSVTLLQMAMVFATIANDGVLCEPRIYERITSSDGEVVDSSEFRAVRRVISQESARRLKAMLCGVVKKGTGVKAAVPGLTVAGKTGTAQKIDKETGTYSATRSWSSFIGFTPPDFPQLLCAVLIDEPLHGEMGGAAAAPAFAKIIGQIISHPQLAYAEHMLGQSVSDTRPLKRDKVSTAVPTPGLCGTTVQQAITFCTSGHIPFEVVGDGRTINNQEPPEGSPLSGGEKLFLYAVNIDGSPVPRSGARMPDCRGKELRDALNAVSIRGLVPHVTGAGFVQRQYPAVGSIVRNAEACTLVCSFGDALKKMEGRLSPENVHDVE